MNLFTKTWKADKVTLLITIMSSSDDIRIRVLLKDKYINFFRKLESNDIWRPSIPTELPNSLRSMSGGYFTLTNREFISGKSSEEILHLRFQFSGDGYFIHGEKKEDFPKKLHPVITGMIEAI